MNDEKDTMLWEEYKKTVAPLRDTRVKKDLIKKLIVTRKQPNLERVLDLHGLTLEKAHQEVLRFLKKNQRLNQRQTRIITGKGKDGQGLIKKEIPYWLDLFSREIKITKTRWQNDGGAIEVRLKGTKK